MVFFVFAAPPGTGGYNPGETLDPECTPGQLVPEPCIVISPLMTADNGLTVTGSNVQLGGSLIQSTTIDQNGNDLAFLNGKVGINNASPQFALDVGGTSTFTASLLNFTGTLNDATIDVSSYFGVNSITYQFNISDTAGPDQITWSDSLGNSGSFLIDGLIQQLSYGVTVIFGNLSGHAGDESWDFSINKTEQGILNVSEQINIGGSYFARQNGSGSVFLGNGVEYLSSISSSFFYGSQAGLNAFNASSSNFFGSNAGNGATNATNSNFFGSNAGSNSINAYESNFFGLGAGGGKFGNDSFNSNFFGTNAGTSAMNAFNSNFFGTRSGQGASEANSSNFIGYEAGFNATNAGSSNFIGVSAGSYADNATLSNFIGYQAGLSAASASNSIFIGYNSGLSDSVDNFSTGGWSILIGDYTNTGGFSNSIALGAGAVNTASNQFYLANSITQMSLRGVNYTLPTTDGSNGDVLTTDSAGGLTWAPAGGGGGAGLQWYAENAAAPGTVPVATGTGSIALGDSAEALAAGMFVYGSIAGNGATNGYNSNFFGNNAGQNATSANNSNFLGQGAGQNATNAASSNFSGNNSGSGATDAANSNFFGNGAGRDAANAYQSNFFGIYAGETATNADNSNFLGSLAGYQATNAFRSNFISQNAGYQATNANNSNFIGNGSGSAATNASHSNFFGNSAGISATNASNSIFIGQSAGQFDTVNNTGNVDNFSILIGKSTSTGGFSNSIAIGGSATNTAANQLQVGSTTRTITSVFIGDSKGTASTSNTFFVGFKTGLNATSASGSNFFGANAGNGSTNAANSNFLGIAAGQSAINANDSNFFGTNAGRSATSAYESNFFGFSAGYQASGADSANFFGKNAGYQATNAYNSNFFGQNAGSGATNAGVSIFIGLNSGVSATSAGNSIFMGQNAGYGATNAANANFFGQSAGNSATNADNSIFIGTSAGSGATNASKSIFLGINAGLNDTINGGNGGSILIGNSTSTGGFSDSIVLGTGGLATASHQLMVNAVDEVKFKGFSGGTQCTVTVGTGMACTSDERLKTNIIDLPTGTLSKLQNVRTVSYNWLQNPNSSLQIGFLAQNLEEYFPEMVMTDTTGMKQVYYSQMTPILVEAIREMNLNVTMLSDMARENTWRDALIAWFGNATNGIENFIAGTIRARSQVCIDDVCINKEQLQSILQNNGIINQPSPIIVTPPPTDDPTIDNTTDDIVTDPDTDTNAPSEEPPASNDDTIPTDNSEPSITTE